MKNIRPRRRTLILLILALLTFPSLADGPEYERVDSPRHHSPIVSLSAQANLLASLSHDGQVFVWRPPAIEPIFSVRLPQKVRGVGLSPNGDLLAVMLVDKVLIYKVATVELVATLEGHKALIESIAFEPGGTRFATASKDKTVRVWTVGEWSDPRVFNHPEVCTAAAFSPDGKSLATACGWEFGQVQLWDLEEEKVVRTMSLDTAENPAATSSYIQPVKKLVFSGDGRLLASGEVTGCKLWDVNSGLLVHRWDRLTNSGIGISTLAIEDSKLSAWDGVAVRQLGLSSGQVERSRELPEGTQRVVFLSGGRLFTGESFGKLKVSASDGQVEWTSGGVDASVSDLAFRPGTTRLYSLHDDGSLVEWESESSQPIRSFETGASEVGGLVFSPDGSLLLHGTKDGLAVRGAEDLALQEELKGHTAKVRQVVLSADGGLAATASNDATIGVWDLSKMELQRRLEGHGAEVTGIAMSPDERRLASVSEDGTVRLWDLVSGKEIRRFEREGAKSAYTAVAISPDGKTLVAAAAFSLEQPLVVWNLADGELVRTITLKGQSSAAMDLFFTPQGALWTADLSGDVCLWNVQSGELQTRLQG